MSFYGAFSSSVLGMRAQAEAISNIGINIANVNTGGYRRIDTQFQTVLGQSMFEQSDIGGVNNKNYNRFDAQGNIVASNSKMDVAISGQGFFAVTDALSGGQELYSRDGAFQMVVNGTESVTDSDNNTFDTAVGYLADKNGYYVLGWAADSNGAIDTNGTPDVMRIDTYAFYDDAVETTDAALRMNLPSTANVDDSYKYVAAMYDTGGNEQALQLEWTKTASNTWDLVSTHESTPVPQINTVTIAGTVEAGDVYTVTVDGSTVSYTVLGTEADIDAVRDGLVAAINADATVSAVVTAAAGASGKLTLTGVTAGDSFTADASGTNGATPVAQVDTVTLSGTVEAGDTYSVTVNGNTVTYTVLAGDTTIDDVRTGLINAVAANGTVSALVTAAAGGTSGQMTLTAVTPGTAFTATSAAANGAVAVAQVDTLTLAGTVEAGDTYSVVVNGTTVTYTTTGGEAGINGIRDGLVAAINANPTVGALLTAAPGGAGQLTLTAATAGTAFTATAAAVNGGGTADNTNAIATTTANATSTADNASAISTTTANGASTSDNTASIVSTQTAANTTVTSSATAFTFDGTGKIESPTTYDFTGTWPNGETTTMTFDFSGLTQYASGDLFVYSYENNGHEAGIMSGIDFDADGKVIGSFSNGRTRTLYQLALADFGNPNALEQKNGNVFAETTESGSPTYVAAGTMGISIQTYAHELSNVDIGEEFAKIIMTQNAYNSSATVFKTVDEMTTVARDLKG